MSQLLTALIHVAIVQCGWLIDLKALARGSKQLDTRVSGSVVTDYYFHVSKAHSSTQRSSYEVCCVHSCRRVNMQIRVRGSEPQNRLSPTVFDIHPRERKIAAFQPQSYSPLL